VSATTEITPTESAAVVGTSLPATERAVPVDHGLEPAAARRRPGRPFRSRHGGPHFRCLNYYAAQ